MAEENKDQSKMDVLKERRNDLRKQLLETTKRANEREKSFYKASGIAATFTAVGVALLTINPVAAAVSFIAGAIFAAGANDMYNKASDAKHQMNILQMDFQIAYDDYKDISLAKMQAKEQARENQRLLAGLDHRQEKQWQEMVKERPEAEEKVVPMR